jgi:hypothetical protein
MDGIILIPSQRTEAGARQALSDLHKASDNPSEALIYTHSHRDYSSGTRGLLLPESAVTLVRRSSQRAESTGGTSGRTTVNAVPVPSWLSTEMLPPCC